MRLSKSRLLLLAACLSNALPAFSRDVSAFFSDCGGAYLMVSPVTGKTIAKGHVKDIPNMHIPGTARDGCVVIDVSTGTASSVILTVQNFVWLSENAKPPYFDVSVHFPDLRAGDRVALNEAPYRPAFEPELSRAQKEFMSSTRPSAFDQEVVLWSIDGTAAIVAEVKGRAGDGRLSIFPEMKMGYSIDPSVSGRFAVYRVSSPEIVSRYEIPKLNTDLSSKVLVAKDGSFAFFGDSGIDGKPKLYLVRSGPPPTVIPVDHGDVDPMWMSGVLVYREEANAQQGDAADAPRR